MDQPIVFFSRCKPQDIDAIELVLTEKRVFIGYPMGRAGVLYNARNLRSCVVDPSCGDEEWSSAHGASDGSRQYNQNRNLIRRVTVGSIALVPRPDRGVVYCGRIASRFELVDAPTWYDRYMEIRGDEDGPDAWHGADVAQCWSVHEFVAVPLTRIPAWIRRSLFGRSTYGVVHPDDISGDPVAVINALIDGDLPPDRPWTLDLAEIEKRMLEDLTPATFEHLVVSILQLENPQQVWQQVGGSGDGGVDGLASLHGDVVALLQCKWQYWGGDPFLGPSLWNADNRSLRRYLAALRYPVGAEIPAESRIDQFLNRAWVAEKVFRHHANLPQAMSMRIGHAL